MKPTCNIDRRGIVVDLCGAGLILTGVLTDSRRMLVGGTCLCVIGSFMIFEGLRGWCALRALGIKTPM
jgi:hypothetical protein